MGFCTFQVGTDSPGYKVGPVLGSFNSALHPWLQMVQRAGVDSLANPFLLSATTTQGGTPELSALSGAFSKGYEMHVEMRCSCTTLPD